MRRNLDPEGYEDPGIKVSRMSLEETSSEWHPRAEGGAGGARGGGGATWGPEGQGQWDQHWHCMAGGTAWAPVSDEHRRCRGGSVARMGVARAVLLHGHLGCTGTGTLWALARRGHCRGHSVGTAGSRAHVAWGSAGASVARAPALHEHRHGMGVSVVRARCTGTRVARVHGKGASIAWAAVLHRCQHDIGVLHGHQRCKGAGVAWVPALHGHWSCMGPVLHGCIAWAPALHGCQRCMGAGVAQACCMGTSTAWVPAWLAETLEVASGKRRDGQAWGHRGPWVGGEGRSEGSRCPSSLPAAGFLCSMQQGGTSPVPTGCRCASQRSRCPQPPRVPSMG